MDEELFNELFGGFTPSDNVNYVNPIEKIQSILVFLGTHSNYIVGIDEIENEYLHRISFYVKKPSKGNGGDDGGQKITPLVPKPAPVSHIEA